MDSQQPMGPPYRVGSRGTSWFSRTQLAAAPTEFLAESVRSIVSRFSAIR
jgi:hypothetical protein